MEQFIRLKQMLLHDVGVKEFENRLSKLSGVLQKQHLSFLLVQLAKIKPFSFEKYFLSLIKHGADINFCSEDTYGVKNQSILMLACQNNIFDNVQHILDFCEVNPLLQDSNNQNAVFYALRNPNQEDSYLLISSLISKYPQLIESQSKNKKSLLFEAIEYKSIRIIQFLLKSKANPNSSNSVQNNNSLHHSLITLQENPQIMKNIILLLLNYGADPYSKNCKNINAFDIAQTIKFDLKRLVELYHNSQVNEPKIMQQFKKSDTQPSATREETSYQIYSQVSQEQQQTKIDIQKQIGQIYTQSQEEYMKAWQDISQIYSQLIRMGAIRYLQVSLIGSYATGLWTADSDIDIALTNTNPHNQIDSVQTLKWIFSNLNKNCQNLSIKQSFININSAFPNIKIVLNSTLNSRKIDVVVFQKRNTALRNLNFIQSSLASYPHIQTLYYLLIKLLKTFKLSSAYKNGLKSYSVFLMILAYVQKAQCSTYTQLFTNFIDYYANQFPYRQQIDQKGQYSIFLDTFDPVNKNNNVNSNKINFQRIYEMFKATDSAIKLGQFGNFQQQGFDYIYELANCFQE